MKKIILKSTLFILEWILISIVLCYKYLKDNNIYEIPASAIISIDDMRKFVYMFYVSPALLFLRLLFQTNSNISKPIYILQNSYMFVIFFIGNSNTFESIIWNYALGVILNLSFIYIDDFCIRKIDFMTDKNKLIS
jgi:hypothetical protein